MNAYILTNVLCRARPALNLSMRERFYLALAEAAVRRAQTRNRELPEQLAYFIFDNLWPIYERHPEQLRALWSVEAA